MRRSLAFLAPLSLCLLATFACEDDRAEGGDAVETDAGLLDVVAPPSADATPTEDAAFLAVTVSVTGSDAARAGIEVVFQYADGSLETKRTTRDGVATSTGATTPSMATALVLGGGRYTPFTWTGIAPGDVLSVPAVESALDLRGDYSVTTAAGTSGNETRVELEASSWSTTSVSFSAGVFSMDVFGPSVQANGTVTILGREYAGTTLTGFAFVKDLVAPAASGTLATLGPWTAPSTLNVTVTNANGAALSSQLIELYGGLPYNLQHLALNEATPAAYQVSTGFADAYQASVVIGDGERVQIHTLRQRSAAPMTFDASRLLSALTNPTVTGNVLEPDFAWDGDTTATAGGAVQIRYGGTAPGPHTWTIFVPPGTRTVHLPKLPDNAAAFRPSPTATLTDYSRPDLLFLEAPGIAPAALRSRIGSFDLASGVVNAARDAPMPADGLYRWTLLKN